MDAESPKLNSRAVIGTSRPARYAKQLASHLGRRHGGDWNAETNTGWINLSTARAELTAGHDTLTVQLIGDDVHRLEDVVARHLERFGAPGELEVSWQRPQPTSSEQGNESH